jgi:hypothetical protein
MADQAHADDENGSIEIIATRLAELLTGAGGGLHDPGRSDLIFEGSLSIRPLDRAGTAAPSDVWAVDGGQGLVADARCLQVYVTRSSTVRWDPATARTIVEDEGQLAAHLLGLGEERRALAALGSPVSPDAAVDVNLLRDWGEWSAAARCVSQCQPGGLVLIDGDLQPDWRIPSWWLADLFAQATDRRVTLVGVTKHTSLSWGGSPLLAVLERLAESRFGPRDCWWAPVARTRPDVDAGLQAVVARLDPDARFSFRVDMPGDADPENVLSQLSTLCDDAAFPGYPYPLTVADRLAACPGWVRDEVWLRIDQVFDQAGVAPDIRDRAFADRHRLMERS